MTEMEMNNGYVSQMVNFGVETYFKGKEVLVKQPTLGPRLGPWVDMGEEKLQAGYKSYAVENVIKSVDDRVDLVVNYTKETNKAITERAAQVYDAPRKLKDASLVYVHDKLQTLKVNPADESNPADLDVSTLFVEAKSVTAERLNQLLDASEGYLQQYLPATQDENSEDEEETPAAKTEIRPTAVRALKVSKVAAKRMRERAFAKMSDLKLRTTDVVHVDLLKYSEWLDLDGKKAVVLVQLEKVDEAVVQPAKEMVTKATKIVSERVSETSHSVNANVITPVVARVSSITVPFADSVLRIVTVVGDQYQEKIVQPRDQIIEMFREELAIQQELAKQKNGDEPMTISAGLQAVITAARARLSKEWEIRISPSLQKILHKEIPEETPEASD